MTGLPEIPEEALPEIPGDGRPDTSEWTAFDTETYKFGRGLVVPRAVCASYASVQGDVTVGGIVAGLFEIRRVFRDLFDVPCTCPGKTDMGGRSVQHHRPECPRKRRVVTFANAAYDLAVMIRVDEELARERGASPAAGVVLEPAIRHLVFEALADRRVYDVLIAESLHAIHGGHLGLMPDGSPLRKPSTGEVTQRYSLDLVSYLNLGRRDAKANDAWRESYALLDGVPLSLWPERAKTYPVDDTRNTLDVALAQVLGAPGPHAWVSGRCVLCKALAGTEGRCPRAARGKPHENLDNLGEQVEVDFAFQLGASWSFRTDPERTEALSKEVDEKHKVFVERFQKKGWYRQDGSEDQAAVKRAIAVAYGAEAPCARCGGTGKVKSTKVAPCRGVKERGRFRQGCLGMECTVCGGAQEVEQVTGDVNCKNVFDEDENLIEAGCDGTGFDLDSVRVLPRTDKLGVKTDRDTTMESGDEDLADFGENQFEKARTTFVPYLKKGYSAPLPYSIDVLKATGRASIEGSPLHQMPRAGLERRCIRARGLWCGYHCETCFGSTDYSAGELCTLAQGTYWLFGYSQMRDAINRSRDPGILHSELAAEVMGISLEEFLVRLKAKDQQAVYFRQASKPLNFGKPAAMGSPKIVLTNRKESAGFTPCEGGPAVYKGKEGYWGIRFCILVGGEKRCGVQKITEWGKNNYPCAPVCKKCVEIEAYILSPAYFRRFPEIKDYHKWVTKMTDAGQLAPSFAWDHDAQKPKAIRWRGGADFSAYANNMFQSMLADITKAAYVRATRECYLGVKDDGSPSPLAGCHLPLVAHDEIFSELILDTAHRSGPRVAEIMIEEGYRIAPQVTWKADTALMRVWLKSAEPKYSFVDGEERLVVWEPEEKAA